MAEEEKQEQKVVNILPLTKWKRVVVFIGDFFLTFMVSFFLLLVMVSPSAKAIAGYENKTKQYHSDFLDRAGILYENKVLFPCDSKVSRSEVSYNTSFTYEVYLTYYLFDEENPEHVEFKQFGHKEENEVIRNYFLNIRKEENKFYSVFDRYNKELNYFVRDGQNISMKSDIKEQLLTYFDTTDKPTGNAEKYYSELGKGLFYPLLAEVMNSIEEHDLEDSKGNSYNYLSVKLEEYNYYLSKLILAIGYISLGLGVIVLFIIIPLCNKRHRTLTMMMMRIQKVDPISFKASSKPVVFLNAFYTLLFTLPVAFLIPIGIVTFQELFSISILFVFTIMGIALQLGSLVFLLFNQFNQSLSDFFTRSVYLTNDSLDEVYRSKGYYI